MFIEEKREIYLKGKLKREMALVCPHPFFTLKIQHSIQEGFIGPPLFGLPPNGLFMFGLSLIGLQGQLDYTQLDYL